MLYTHSEMLKLLHDTGAVSVWDHARGPVFWYAANVPGPFYVNTEKAIGAALAERLLREITAIVAGTVDAEARAAQLEHLIMEAYKTSPSWQRLIATLLDHARAEFPAHEFTMISGGERRDWLFSIPFAHACDMPHLFLFKNKSFFCAKHITPGQKTLHVSDLINNAASFFDLWQPALQGLRLGCGGNLCVNIRGDNGLKRLREAGLKTVALVTIDLDYFRRLHAEDLISRAVFEEIAIFFASPQEWAVAYLLGRPEVFDVAGCDAKSFERLKFFIAGDPWKLRAKHQAFFADMQAAIERRVGKAA